MEKERKILNFEFDAVVVDNDKFDKFTVVELDIVTDGNNLNNIPLTPESVINSAESLVDSPLLVDMKYGRATTHSKEEKGVGLFKYKEDIKFVMKNGKNWLTSKAYIWRDYAVDLIEYLRQNGGKLPVSMEIVINDRKIINGIDWVTDFEFKGVTILGSTVQEAVVGANMKVLSFAKLNEEFDNEVFSHSDKYKDIDFKIPKNVKENVKSALTKHSELSFKASSNSLGIARMLAREEKISIEKLNKIKDFFDRYDKKEHTEENSTYTLYGGKVSRDWVNSTSRKIKEADSFISASFGKETEMAKSLKVNKSKEAMSDSSWGDVDKISLRDKIMEASNKSSIVHDVYMEVIDGWEDKPSENLKYPVMELKGDELVYNRNGLSSALGYAKADGSSELVNKIEAIYKKLDLDKDEKEEKNPVVKKKKKFEIEGREAWGDVISQVHKELGSHFYVDSVEKNKIVVTDTKTKKRYDISADVEVGKDDKKVSANIKWETKKESKDQKAFEEDDDDIEEEDDEIADGVEDEDEKKDKAEMSLDSYVDSSANEELLKKETKLNRKLADEDDKDFEKLMACEDFAEKDIAEMSQEDCDLYFESVTKELDKFSLFTEKKLMSMKPEKLSKLACKMAKTCSMAKNANSVYLSKKKELSKFKADIEEKEKMAKVECALDNVKNDISKEEMAELKKEAEKFSFAEIGKWEITVKAVAYDSRNKKTEDKNKAIKGFACWDTSGSEVSTGVKW